MARKINVQLICHSLIIQHIKKDRERLYAKACSDSTKGNNFKVEEGKFILDIRKKLFTLGVVRPFPRLPREAVAAPSLAVFKARLDGALSNLGWWKVSQSMAGGLEWQRSLRSFPTQTVL